MTIMTVDLATGEITQRELTPEEIAALPPSEPPPLPQSVTMRQARLVLLAADLLDDVDAAIAAIPDATHRKAAQIEWEFAATVDRQSPFTQQLAAGLGLDDAALDALFTEAATL